MFNSLISTINRIGVVIIVTIAIFLVLNVQPVYSQGIRQFKPIEQGQVYERQFLNDFWSSLGVKPPNLTWVEESETVRILVSAGSMALRGDTDGALGMFDLLPPSTASSFTFITTMREDLLTPAVLEPWIKDKQAREMLFEFYRKDWLPHPEYRDDFKAFSEDTKGRASRLATTAPAVWILANLPSYGFIPDQNLQTDEPYLFLWNLLMDFSRYAQRASFYGLQWDKYDERDFKFAVVARAGKKIKEAHDQAAKNELRHSFWSQLIDKYQPLSTPAQGQETPIGVQTQETPTAHSRELPADSTQKLGNAPESTYDYIFRVPTEVSSEKTLAQQIEEKIEALEKRVATEAPESPVEEVGKEIESTTETQPSEITPQEPGGFEYPTSPPAVEEKPLKTPAAPELGNYAATRLAQIADDLKTRIVTLVKDLGQETIDLVIIYNDINISNEARTSAENRYIAKRQAFLAGLAVWDRFTLEIYSSLTLADFNNLLISSLKSPYEQLKKSKTQWDQYSIHESKFDRAFAQIETGIRTRREDPDVIEAEEKALTVFLPDYNSIIKEIEDLTAQTPKIGAE